MGGTKKCPICGVTISDDSDKCRECGMEGLNRIFLDEEEYKEWAASSLAPRRGGGPAGRMLKEVKKNGIRFDEINLEPYSQYNEFAGNPVPEIEKEKYRLTLRTKECIEAGEFETAAALMERNAAICHEQGKEGDAYALEHGAFLCRQRAICQAAGYMPDVFRDVPESVPNVKLLQGTLTRMADQAFLDNSGDLFILCKLMNARFCRAMGEERDAYLLETSAYGHQSAPTPEAWENLRQRALEEPHFLKQVADEYRKDFNKISED